MECREKISTKLVIAGILLPPTVTSKGVDLIEMPKFWKYFRFYPPPLYCSLIVLGVITPQNWFLQIKRILCLTLKILNFIPPSPSVTTQALATLLHQKKNNTVCSNNGNKTK